MRFYCMHKTADVGVSFGYEFFTNKAAAEKAVKEWNKDNHQCDRTTVDVISIKPTKAGILRALNHYASHADNG